LLWFNSFFTKNDTAYIYWYEIIGETTGVVTGILI
jgi:hypothetical protein